MEIKIKIRDDRVVDISTKYKKPTRGTVDAVIEATMLIVEQLEHELLKESIDDLIMSTFKTKMSKIPFGS